MPSLKRGFPRPKHGTHMFLPLFGAAGCKVRKNVETPQTIYSMFGSEYGSLCVNSNSEQAPLPQGVKKLKIYPNFAHISKHCSGDKWEEVPNQIAGLRTSLDNMDKKIHHLIENSSAIGLYGARVEFTIHNLKWEDLKNVWNHDLSFVKRHLKGKAAVAT